MRKKDAGGRIPPAWLEIDGDWFLVRVIRVGVRIPWGLLLTAERVDALDPERASDPSRIAWVRLTSGARGDSGLELRGSLEPEPMRIVGSAEDEGNEGGWWEVAIVVY